MVSVAWPYANGDLHAGHIAGAYLPADIFARYHRLKGGRVLMVSGSGRARHADHRGARRPKAGQDAARGLRALPRIVS
jgi:valyl-tRNA synthetase